MKFRYLGKEDVMSVFGYDFSGGATPDVVEERFIGKLSGNAHFEAVTDGEVPVAPVVPAAPVAPVVPEVKEKQSAAKKDKDLDGKEDWPVSV